MTHSFAIRKLSFLIFCLLSLTLSGQDGDYYVSNHSISHESSKLDNVNFDVEIARNGLLSVANRQGVVFYDGKSWEYFKTPGAAMSVASGAEEVTYVGCVGDFGKVDFAGEVVSFISLSDTLGADYSYFQTTYFDGKAYFLSEKVLKVYNENADKLETFFPSNKEEQFDYIFSMGGGDVFVASDLKLYRFSDKGLVQFDDQIVPSEADIQSVCFDEVSKVSLIATTENEIFSYRNGTIENKLKVDLNVDSALVDIVQIEWINPSSFAVSTISSGVLIYDFKTGNRLGHLDYNRGLPDNEIYDIERDLNEGLWITHEYGLTRVCPDIPVKSYTSYPGLQGNLLGILKYDDDLYVGSSQGVFVFNEEKQYENIVYYKKITVSEPNKARNKKKDRSSTRGSKASNSKTQKKKKLQLFKKKNKSEVSDNKDVKTKKRRSKRKVVNKVKEGDQSIVTKVFKKLTNTLVTASEQLKRKEKDPTVKYERRIRKKLVNTYYHFKRIEGMHSKAKQMVEFKGVLLAAGNGGLHQIDQNVASLVISDPIRQVKVLQEQEKLLVSMASNELFLYDYQDSIWVITDSLPKPGNPVVSILDYESDRVVMAGTTSLYDLKLNETHRDFQEVTIPNQYYDNIKITNLDDGVYLINGQGYFRYDDKNGLVEEDTLMKKKIGRPLKHLQQTNGLVWIYNGKKWGRIERDKSITSFDYFSLFQDMSFVDEYNGAFWIINQQQELIRFDPSLADSLSVHSKMFFKRISTNIGSVGRQSGLVFDYDNNSIKFEVSRPDYLGFLNVEYQYMMEGLDKKWSQWSPDNHFSFNYLRPNRYVLKVRSKDAFGNIQESDPFHFKIKLPYWQEPWFNMLQVLIFASLILFSSRLNRKGESKYIWLTRILTVVTLVLVIEFLQTVAQTYLNIESTPVVEFLINVGVALLVFPIEILLKRIIRVDF